MRLRHTAAALTVLGLLASGTVHSGGSDVGMIRGPTGTLNGATVSTWARVGPGDTILEVGFTLPMAAVMNASHQGPPALASIAFPDIVRQKTFLNHLGLDFLPQGHEPPGRYDVPHFDVHFFGISQAAVRAIDCRDLRHPSPANVPQGWLPPVPPGADPKAFCVPHMGFHALPATEFASPGALVPGAFESVMIAGFYGGQYVFLEPMVTHQLLMRRQSFTLPVPQPVSLGRATLYPTQFNARWDPSANAYHFVLSGFQAVR